MCFGGYGPPRLGDTVFLSVEAFQGEVLPRLYPLIVQNIRSRSAEDHSAVA